MKALFTTVLVFALAAHAHANELLAGVAKVDISDRTVPMNDPCFAKALVLRQNQESAVIITIDAVAIGGIGRIGNGFMTSLRAMLERQAAIAPERVIINASHCHGIVRADLEPLILRAVQEAKGRLVPVKAGAGSGTESRISENRRLKMKDGSEVDMRRAYSMPRDEDVASVGPIDPQIGLLRLDREDGTPLAVLYNFACHPIMNPPSKGSSADYPGFASKVIEDALGSGAIALFVQGCCGDINPVRYKEVSRPADAEPLGTMLGASVLAAMRGIECKPDAALKLSREMLAVPRAADYAQRIRSIEAEQQKALAALRPTNINFKTFLPLLIEQRLSPDMPSHYSQSYLHDRALDKKAIPQLDDDNRAAVSSYLANIDIMERLTRLNTNLALLKKHQKETADAGSAVIDTEVCGLRVGDFKLVTFPGELTVQIGLHLKKAINDPHAFVAGYTNGYIFYTPTTEQRKNTGYAQEDCDSLVAPEWQQLFETKALEVLRGL